MLFSLIATTTLTAFFTPHFAYADTLPVIPDPVPIVQEMPQYCSCVAGVRVYVPTLAHMDAVWFASLPHSTPAPGRVVVFNYSGIYHVAYILSVTEEGFTVYEWNYHHCQKDTRFISWNDPHIASFFAPEGFDSS